MPTLSELAERAATALRALLEVEFGGRPVIFDSQEPVVVWSAVHERRLARFEMAILVSESSWVVAQDISGAVLLCEPWPKEAGAAADLPPELLQSLPDGDPVELEQLEEDAHKHLDRLALAAVAAQLSASNGLQLRRGERWTQGAAVLSRLEACERLPRAAHVHLDADLGSLFSWSLPHRAEAYAQGRLETSRAPELARTAVSPPPEAVLIGVEQSAEGEPLRVDFGREVENLRVEGEFVSVWLHPCDGRPLSALLVWTESPVLAVDPLPDEGLARASAEGQRLTVGVDPLQAWKSTEPRWVRLTEEREGEVADKRWQRARVVRYEGDSPYAGSWVELAIGGAGQLLKVQRSM